MITVSIWLWSELYCPCQVIPNSVTRLFRLLMAFLILGEILLALGKPGNFRLCPVF